MIGALSVSEWVSSSSAHNFHSQPLTLLRKEIYHHDMKSELALSCAALLLAGCSRSNNLLLGEVEAQVGRHTVRETDCWPHQRPAAGAGWPMNGQASYRFIPCRDAEVEIRAGELVVNGRSYGRIGDNDTVLVDHGVVSVNRAELRAHGGK